MPIYLLFFFFFGCNAVEPTKLCNQIQTVYKENCCGGAQPEILDQLVELYCGTGTIWDHLSNRCVSEKAAFSLGAALTTFGVDSEGEMYFATKPSIHIGEMDSTVYKMEEEGALAIGTFSNVVDIRAHGSELLIVEQQGLIKYVNGTVFLDLREKVFVGFTVGGNYSEQGLLGFISRNESTFYVHYTSRNPGTQVDLWGVPLATSIISEFVEQEEKVLLEVNQPVMNHNGGGMAIGPDGSLFVGFGDGGGAGDPFGAHGNGQNMSTYLGKIVRIDSAGSATIYASGFRNPWKMSFDGEDFWVPDVGQGMWEEINLVVENGNYGWRVKEGTHVYNETETCENCLDPIFEYSHEKTTFPYGLSIIGGYVYHGSISSLQNKYIFGDWSKNWNGQSGSIYSYSNGTIEPINLHLPLCTSATLALPSQGVPAKANHTIPWVWSNSPYDTVTIARGDRVFFDYGGGHDVSKFSDQTAYNNCDFSTATEWKGDPGPYTHTFNEPGTFYIGCTLTYHCANGNMKVIIVVT